MGLRLFGESFDEVIQRNVFTVRRYFACSIQSSANIKAINNFSYWNVPKVTRFMCSFSSKTVFIALFENYVYDKDIKSSFKSQLLT